jgi:hypothetical protein
MVISFGTAWWRHKGHRTLGHRFTRTHGKRKSPEIRWMTKLPHVTDGAIVTMSGATAS